jgi:hypothetical protein
MTPNICPVKNKMNARRGLDDTCILQASALDICQHRLFSVLVCVETPDRQRIRVAPGGPYELLVVGSEV